MFRIIPRAEWGSKYGRGGARIGNSLGEIVWHTAAAKFTSKDFGATKRHVQGIQRFHVRSRGWSDIGYSFVISPGGHILEGRGWNRSGAHTQKGRNSTAYGVCFLGHGDINPLTDQQIEAGKWLTAEAKRLGKVRSSVKMSGHRQYAAKSCPGNLVFPVIQSGVLNTGTASAPTQSASPELPLLELGSQSKFVSNMTTALVNAGHGIGIKSGQNKFDNSVLTSVKDFQAYYGLETDGLVGPKTWAQLYFVAFTGAKKENFDRAYPGQVKLTWPRQNGFGPRRWEEAMHKAGFAVSQNGSWDWVDDKRLKTLQQTSKIQVDGIGGPNTWKKLMERI